MSATVLGKQQSITDHFEKVTLVFMTICVCISIFWSVDFWLSNHSSVREQLVRTSRMKVAETIAADSDPDFNINRCLLPFLRFYNQTHQIDPGKAASDIFNETGVNVALYLFDSAGKLSRTFPEKAENTWLIRNLYNSLIESDQQKILELSKSLDKKIEFSFGYGKGLNFIRDNSERIIKTVYRNVPGILAWTSNSKGGLIVTSKTFPDRQQILQRKYGNSGDIKKLGILSPAFHFENRLSGIARRALLNKSSDSGEYAGFDWYFINTITDETIYVAFAGLQNNRHRAGLLKFVVICLSSFLILLLFNTSRERALSLERLIVLLFFTSSFIPLASITSFWFESLNVSKEIFLNKLKSGKEEVAENMILGYSDFLTDCSANLLETTKMPGNGHGDPNTLLMMENLKKSFPQAKLTLRNVAGEKIYSNYVDNSAGRDAIYQSMARALVERYISERADEKRYNGNLFSDSMVKKGGMLSPMLVFPGRIQPLRIGEAEHLMFMRVISDSTVECAVVTVELPVFDMVKRYLKTISSANHSVGNLNLEIAAFFPDGYVWPLPPASTYADAAQEIAEVACATGKSLFRSLHKENAMLFALPSSELGNHCLVSFCSIEALDQQQNAAVRKAMQAAVLVCLLFIAIGVCVSKQLLSPLKSLNSGVNDMIARKYSAQLSVPAGNDEFARFFRAFNTLMQEEYDLQVANKVQLCLIPAVFPASEEYSMFGSIQLASEIGGDCLDCLRLDDGKIFFMLGDIAGLNVASAFVAAFVKAVSFHWSKEDHPSLCDFIDRIDSMLRHHLRQKLFMGAVCGILNTETSQIELVTRGHLYPLLIHADGTKKWIGQPSYPVGTARQPTRESCIIDFSPGDSLLCISNGFLNPYRNNRHLIDYEMIEQMICTSRSLDAKKWIADLHDIINSHISGSQNDDITIFALTRNSGDNLNG